MTIKDMKKSNGVAASHRCQNSLHSKGMLSKIITALLTVAMMVSFGSVMAQETDGDIGQIDLETACENYAYKVS